jgi:hypothetical protein
MTGTGVVEVYEAEAVIVTLPLGVLKSNTVSFSPSLPAKKREVIDRMGVGYVAACCVRCYLCGGRLLLRFHYHDHWVPITNCQLCVVLLCLQSHEQGRHEVCNEVLAVRTLVLQSERGRSLRHPVFFSRHSAGACTRRPSIAEFLRTSWRILVFSGSCALMCLAVIPRWVCRARIAIF